MIIDSDEYIQDMTRIEKDKWYICHTQFGLADVGFKVKYTDYINKNGLRFVDENGMYYSIKFDEIEKYFKPIEVKENNMTKEEKAKRYDEVLEKVKDMLKHRVLPLILDESDFEHIFPELQESEDEKIRKEIIDFLGLPHPQFVGKRDHEKWIAWLEKKRYSEAELENEYWRGYDDAKKQGEPTDIPVDVVLDSNKDGLIADTIKYKNEQKPADKVEPKFYEGDWVFIEEVKGYKNGPFQIKTVDSFGYSFDEYHTIPFMYEDLLSKWTIQDAKDGDVLVVDNVIFIYKRTLASHTVSYCKLINDTFEPNEDARTCCEGNTYIHPATKEQRDTLMKAMTDAGYTFDFEKKVLKKIEQKPLSKFEVGDIMRTLQEATDNITSGLPVVVSIDEEYYHCTNELIAIKDQDDYEYPPMNRRQKPAWSEEDASNLEFVIRQLRIITDEKHFAPIIAWLKSLKDRIQPQPKQEWSEEDEKNFKKAIKVLKVTNFHHTADMLQEMKYKLIPKQEWSEEDEENFNTLSKIICDSQASAKIANKLSDWLEFIKNKS